MRYSAPCHLVESGIVSKPGFSGSHISLAYHISEKRLWIFQYQLCGKTYIDGNNNIVLSPVYSIAADSIFPVRVRTSRTFKFLPGYFIQRFGFKQMQIRSYMWDDFLINPGFFIGLFFYNIEIRIQVAH